MISNSVALEELRNSWNGVRELRKSIQASLLGSFAQGASFVIFIADAAHNLPLVHVYSVLNEVLLQLREEKHFECKNFFLGHLLTNSKNCLPWRDFDLVKEGADRRNDIAHRGKILPRGDCWKYIDAIEKELIGWEIVKKEP